MVYNITFNINSIVELSVLSYLRYFNQLYIL